MLEAAPKALKWLLPIVVIVSLLASLGYYIISSAPVFAQDDGEQSAQILPDDIEFYFSINLDEIDLGGFIAGEGDLAAIWDNWVEGLELAGLDPGYWLGQVELPEWVDIDDILALFGPELAVGIRDTMNFEQGSEYIVLLGTKDKSYSGFLFFNHILPEMTGLTPGELEGMIEPYYGIDTLIFEDVFGMDVYLAFPEDWVIFYIASQDKGGALFYDTLDLIRGVTPVEDSLYGPEGSIFRDAQENLPPDRMSMSYIDIEDILTDALVAFEIIAPGESLPETIEIPIDGIMTIYLHFFYLPDAIAGANSFNENGITSATYYHYPTEMAPPDPGDDLRYSTKIVPADALLFTSGQNPYATWEYICEEIDAGVAAEEEWAIALDEQIDAINDMLAPYTLDSIFGLMDQELAYALLPVELYDEGWAPPQLMLIEMTDADMATAQEMMEDLFAALGLEFEGFTVDGVTAYRPTEESWNGLLGETVPRFGYFFLEDIPTDGGDTTNFLVIGFPAEDELNALEAALDASNGAIPSLDEADDFNAILGMLGVSPGAPGASLSYITFNGIWSNIASLLGEDIPTEFAIPSYLMSPLRALGSSTTYITESPEVTAMLTTSAVYINIVEPIVPLSSVPWSDWKQGVGTGTWNTEVEALLVPLDPDIGYVSVGIEGNTEAGDASVRVCKETSSEVWNGFALAASEAGLSISDIAYVVDVDAPESTGPATITMTVGCDWVDSQGGPDNIKIFRYSDGTCTMLDTEFVGEEDGVCVFQATSPGLSIFGLIAVATPAVAPAAGLNWTLIGGIIGGVLVVVGIGTAVFFLRRRPRPV